MSDEYTRTMDAARRNYDFAFGRKEAEKFDAILAAHDAEVAAKARREALEEAAKRIDGDTSLYAAIEKLAGGANPSTAADLIQDAAADAIRALIETPAPPKKAMSYPEMKSWLDRMRIPAAPTTPEGPRGD